METRTFETERKFQNRNQKTATELVTERNHTIEVFDFTDSKGVKRYFATCGGRDTAMYVTPAAKVILEDNKLTGEEKIEKLQYFECIDEKMIGAENEEKYWVPCLAAIGKMQPAKLTLGLHLLRK